MKHPVFCALVLALCASLLFGLTGAAAQPAHTHIVLDDAGVSVDGAPISKEPTDAVYAANDIVCYLAGQDFTYGEGTEEDAHSPEEASAHTVVHIAKPGVYRISGTLSAGQIAVDLGEDAKQDEDAVVTLILDGADVTCTVAPAIIFYNVYECGDDDPDTAAMEADTRAAGANVILADGSVNTLRGSYVARIYESVELSEDGTQVIDSKKLHKYDGALYSKRTMNISGEAAGDGVLSIFAENEGIGSELHLTISGGVIHIVSGDDGINVNEDEVSVCAITGGEVNIVVSGAKGEGDGIDSNGWLVISGGRVSASACAFSGDAGVDAAMGIHITGGEVTASGNMFDRIADSEQPHAVFSFASRMPGGTAVTLKNADGETVGQYAPANDYSYLVVSGAELVPGTYSLWQGETRLAGCADEMRGHGGAQMPEGSAPDMTPPDMQEGFAPDMTPPDMPEGFAPDMTPPDMPEGFAPDAQGFAQRERQRSGAHAQQRETPGRQGGGRVGRGFAQNAGELSADFVIAEGGTMFTGVAPMAEE